MASDSQDSRRKHHRSTSDEESSERAKRHKHRHRRHHRHRHGSGSKKSLDAEIEAFAGTGIENGGVGEIFEDFVRSVKSKSIEYDMEEGEIVEDDVVLSEIGAKKSGSDVESTEFDAARAPMSDTITENGETDLKTGVNRKKGNGGDELSVGVSDANVDIDYQQFDKDNEVYIKSHKKSSSLMKGKSKLKGSNGLADREEVSELMQVDEGELTDLRTSLSHVSVANGTEKEFRSPHHGSHHDEIYHTKRSKSPDCARKKSHSRYTVEEEPSRRSSDHYNYRRDARGLVKDEERERSSSDKRRYSHSEDKYFDPEYREHEETLRERGNGKDARVRAREVEREREWNHNREHENGREFERKREKVRERSRDLEYDTYRDREKGRGRSGERDLEREHMSTYRDRDKERRRDRYRDGDERLRDSRSDRHTDEPRGSGSDRNRQYGRYDYDNEHGHRGRSYDTRHGTYDEGRSHEDRHRKYSKEKDPSCEDPLKGNKVERDEDDQDDFSENVLETIEQEEEDINRIKEESRRRREAILQKYRNQQLQKPDEPQAKSAEKDSSQEEPVDKGEDHEHDVSNQVFSVGKSPSRNEVDAADKGSGAGGLGEGTIKSEKSHDMFCDDIFGDSPAGGHKMGKGDGTIVQRSGLRDNWDDAEGYYSYRLGELLDGRYEITAAHGKGVFSTVVRAKDLKAGIEGPEEVAIKMIRNNDTMLKAGMEELVILKKLVGADPEDRRHCVRYFSSFKYRNHLCLVFESLNMNLREVLKKFGRNIGLKLTAVRLYSKQLFIALKHLKNCGVLHCDIKPDNMLVNDANNVLKLCDFGNAMFAGKNEVTPYLVSRFYRSPEIILGLQYDHPLDMWSVGCCLYELYTGKVLFPGHTNNEMLRLHMELKGPFSKKMLRKGTFTDQNFDQDFNFLSIEEDPVTKKILRKPVINIKPKDIGNLIKGSPGEDPKLLANFKDLLDKMFVLDPDKRLTVSQALSHPFVTGK